MNKKYVGLFLLLTAIGFGVFQTGKVYIAHKAIESKPTNVRMTLVELELDQGDVDSFDFTLTDGTMGRGRLGLSMRQGSRVKLINMLNDCTRIQIIFKQKEKVSLVDLWVNQNDKAFSVTQWLLDNKLAYKQ